VNAKLARTGRLGLHAEHDRQERTNTYQHLAVEKNRLHIPLLFGADVIPRIQDDLSVPLGLAGNWDSGDSREGLPHLCRRGQHSGCALVLFAHGHISRESALGTYDGRCGRRCVSRAAHGARLHPRLPGDDLSKPGAVAASVKHFARIGRRRQGASTTLPTCRRSHCGRCICHPKGWR